MSNFPEDQPDHPLPNYPVPDHPVQDAVQAPSYDGQMAPREILAEGVPQADTEPLADMESLADMEPPAEIEPLAAEPPFTLAFAQPEPPPPPPRIPHFGHFLLLLVLLVIGFIGAIGVLLLGVHFHVYGVTSIEATKTEIHYTLGSEGLGYVFTLCLSLIVFPLLWHKSFFSGIQWNGATAIRLRWRLVSAALLCMLLALVNSLVLPGPKHAPIEDIFREPGAAWLLFAFGVTFAPFFEEMFFRGFLLPALCTAYDWCAEKMYGAPRLPLLEDGHPQWSFPAMVTGAVVTSIPFAWMHAAQTGYSIGPFLLLVGVSIVLCSVRLWTRSLASSTLVHASYNFMLFSIMFIGTSGFRHLDKM